MLCIWTDIDPAHEVDFNRWYDREHMQERVAIAGFQSARRFAATLQIRNGNEVADAKNLIGLLQIGAEFGGLTRSACDNLNWAMGPF